MKFLIDANLPPGLASFLRKKGFESTHLIEVNMLNAKDTVVWNFAKENAYVIMTKDEDFRIRVEFNPSGPAVVWLRIGNCSKKALIAWIDPLIPVIIQSLKAGERLIEVL